MTAESATALARDPAAPPAQRPRGRSTSDLLPSDTAVAATTSEIVRVTVATSSSATARRLDSFLPASGGAKPGLPESSVIGVILGGHPRESNQVLLASSPRMPARVRLDLGEVIEEARRFREFWLMDG
jgi:hypothetical protein